MRKSTVAIFCLAGTVLSSCDLVERSVADPEPSIADAGQLVEPNPFDELMDLATILDPKGVARDNYENNDWEKLPKGQQTDFAFQAFYDTSAYPGDIELRRNRIQERLLVESNRRCTLFKSLVYQIRAKTNFMLGALGTITGVAGGIVTGVDGSRILSGTSGIFSGLRAEFNQELFQNLATQVIVQGVDTRRREVYDAIATKGQAKPIDVYPVEAAVKDAIFYHGQCSVIVGFQMARDAIKTVEDPGIEAANRTLAKLTVTRKLLDIGTLTPEEAVALLAGTNAGLTLAGTPLGKPTEEALPIQALRDASGRIRRKTESFRKFVQDLALAEKDADGKPPSDAKKQALEKQKKDLLESLTGASAGARTALQACNEEAFKKSQEVLAADQEIDAAANEEDKLKAQNSRDRLFLSALEVSEKIGLIPKLFGAHLDAAMAILSKGTPMLAQAEPLDNNVVTSAKTEVEKAKKIEGCKKKV